MDEVEEKNMRVFPVVDDGELRYDELKRNNFRYTSLPPENVRVIPGVGDVVMDEEILDVRKQIVDEASALGFPVKLAISDAAKTKFDKTVGEILFDSMDITPSVAATLPMWHFINIYLIPDIIFWRWGLSSDRFISPRRNYAGTQWWRYYLFSGSEESLDIFDKISEGEIADLYERSGTAGLPDHISDIAIWFDELNNQNGDVRPRDLWRETIKLYNAELGYRLYYSLSPEQRHELFKSSYVKALEKCNSGEESNRGR